MALSYLCKSTQYVNQAVADADAATVGSEVESENTAFGRQVSVSLTRLINQEQSFRVVTSEPGVVYSKSHFYKPSIDEALMSILESCDEVDQVVSEKGDTRLTSAADWDSKTLFGLVYGWISVAPAGTVQLAKDLNKCATVICDDRNRETADFYGIDHEARRVLLVHGKAIADTPNASARRLQDVTRQALASLAFAGSSRRPFPYSTTWESDWKVVLEDAAGASISKPRIMTKGTASGTAPTLTPKEHHKELLKALADPTYTKEVVMFTGGLLSRTSALATLNSTAQLNLQFLYFLAAVRSTFDRAGVRFRIICNK